MMLKSTGNASRETRSMIESKPVNYARSNGQLDEPEQPIKIVTAPLHRFVRLCDQKDTQIFTFVIVPQLIRGLVDQISSMPFVYGHHLWRLIVHRKEPHLGVFLECLSIANCFEDGSNSQDCNVVVDATFSIQNRQHFSRNEQFELNRVVFSLEERQVGRNAFIELAELSSRKFLFDDGKCLLEVQLQQIKTTLNLNAYPCQDPANKGPFGFKGAGTHTVHAAGINGVPVQIPVHAYLETSVFNYAGFMWKFA
ncbi:hypothetical protein Ciccas_010121, partial [Cichlidogyrus casuarinus]